VTEPPAAVKIAEVTAEDLEEWVDLALKLWPESEEGGSDRDEMTAELMGILRSRRDTGFLARDPQGRAIGFINLSLCNDYVPGARRFPVAYVEGIYVEESSRKQRIGAALVAQAEVWAEQRGCAQLASDVAIENEGSYHFHLNTDFKEVERVIFFIKTVRDADLDNDLDDDLDKEFEL
jgi:aminoglycoside 6'-N-acetyltransferase I